MLAVLIGSTGVFTTSNSAYGSESIFCKFKDLKITGDLKDVKQLKFLKLNNEVVGDGVLNMEFTVANGRWDWKKIEGPIGASTGHNKLLSMLFYGRSSISDRIVISYEKKTDMRPFPLGKITDGLMSVRLDTGAYFKMSTSGQSYISYELPKVLNIYAAGSCGQENIKLNSNKIENRLTKLKELEASGLITKKEAAEKRKAILDSL